MGGAVLSVPDGTTIRGEDREYPGLYARFGDLIRAGASEVDSEPLRLVAEAFLRGRLETVADFYD
jgi:D-galactose 1-dehydrogenase